MTSPINLLQEITEHFHGGDWEGARAIWSGILIDLEIEDALWIWDLLDSRERAFLKGEDRKYLHEYLRPGEDLPKDDGSRK